MRQKTCEQRKISAHLVVDGLCGVEVAHVQAQPHLAADGIARVELSGADYVFLTAQSKELAFDVVDAQLGVDTQTCEKQQQQTGGGGSGGLR